MKIVNLLSVLFVIILCVFFYLGFSKESPKNLSFLRIPISFFPFLDRPTMKVEIEGKKYSLLVDLGSSFPVFLHKKYIDKIEDKESAGIFKSFDVNGNCYERAGFKVGDVKLQENCKLTGVVIISEDIDFLLKGCKISPPGIWHRLMDQLELLIMSGRIGLPVFRAGDCFFDFPNSYIVVADNITSLIDRAGCSVDGFVQVPFNLEKYGVILTLQTDLGLKKFVLDTGATHSILKKSQVAKEIAKEFKPGKWFYRNHKTEIAGCNFGICNFVLFDFTDRFEVDGILGVDFFKKHAICLDFHNQIAYIQPPKKENELREKLSAWLMGISD